MINGPLQIDLCFDLLPGDRLAGLVHGPVSLGGVFGVLGSAESIDHRFRDDGGHALTANGEMGDDTTAGQLDRLLDGWAADGEIACGSLIRTRVETVTTCRETQPTAQGTKRTNPTRPARPSKFLLANPLAGQTD
jgi:hypothetical protein